MGGVSHVDRTARYIIACQQVNEGGLLSIRANDVDVAPGLAEDLRSAVIRLSKRLRRTRAGSDLTSAETTVLAIASRRGPVGLTELAHTEDMNPTMLSRVLRSLESRGLVSRIVDPTDRRAALVNATAAGT